MEFKNLESCDFETLFRGFERAFEDYEIHFDKPEVQSMLCRRGYNPQLSFAAFDNGEIVAFTLNGTGLFNGVFTAYDTGTGTVREYRGQGLAGRIFTHSIPFLRQAGVRQYLLEVLQSNQKAISVYRKMNFEVAREFDCYRQSIENINKQLSVRTSMADCTVCKVNVDSIRRMQVYCDFYPSWQNNVESIERGKDNLTCLGAFIDGEPAGYCVFDKISGDLTQIAVKNEYRRKGIASGLLREALGRMHTDFIKVLNVSPDNLTLSAFLTAMGVSPASKQFEMILPL